MRGAGTGIPITVERAPWDFPFPLSRQEPLKEHRTTARSFEKGEGVFKKLDVPGKGMIFDCQWSAPAVVFILLPEGNPTHAEAKQVAVAGVLS